MALATKEKVFSENTEKWLRKELGDQGYNKFLEYINIKDSSKREDYLENLKKQGEMSLSLKLTLLANRLTKGKEDKLVMTAENIKEYRNILSPLNTMKRGIEEISSGKLAEVTPVPMEPKTKVRRVKFTDEEADRVTAKVEQVEFTEADIITGKVEQVELSKKSKKKGVLATSITVPFSLGEYKIVLQGTFTKEEIEKNFIGNPTAIKNAFENGSILAVTEYQHFRGGKPVNHDIKNKETQEYLTKIFTEGMPGPITRQKPSVAKVEHGFYKTKE